MFTPNPRVSQGHNKKKITKGSSKNIRKYNFSVKSIKLWNSLPQHVVDSEDVKSFEIGLDEFWNDQVVMYDDFTQDIKIINNRRLTDYQI